VGRLAVLRRLGVLAAALVLAAGCDGEAGSAPAAPRVGEPVPAYGDTLIEASLGNVSGLIPNITNDAPSHAVGDLLYNGLVKVDRDLRLVGELARSWEFSRDCLTLTFRLHDDVRWHDGRPFTADDVVFTWAAMVNPKTPNPYKSDLQDVERVEALDPHTVRVTYARPYAKALLSWGMKILPRHLLEEYVEAGKLREAPQNWSAPVGTGPYRFQEMKSGEKIVLVANQEYFAGRPHISRVVYRIIPSQATIFLELKAKGVDVAGLTALQYTRQTEYPAFERAYNKFRYPGSGYTYLGFNLQDPRFADHRVRMAFAHAINKQEILQGVVFGLGREATGPFRPGTWAENPDVRPVPHDLPRAQALLAAAGWTQRNADGLLVKDGRPFTFELLTNQGNDERKKIAEIIQASLRELGVGVEIRVLEWASFLKEHVNKRRFDAIVLGWGTGIDPDQYLIWHSSQMGPDQLNVISYRNREVDALLEKGRATCEQSERVATYHRLHALLAADQPVIFLYWRDALPAVSGRVHGVDPGPAGLSWNFTEWFVPKHLHRYTAG
jgi:peptide/nickel transport system substrate-binding protein